MVSARNYWTIDQLWQDYHYWRGQRTRWRRAINAERNRYGYVGKSLHRCLVKAEANMIASRRILRKRKAGLNAPDMLAQLAVEGYSRFERVSCRRY